MRFNEAWLREWVNPAIDTDTLVQQLTMAGLELEGIDDIASRLKGVIVAEVTACERHPNADRLSVCQVNLGTNG